MELHGHGLWVGSMLPHKVLEMLSLELLEGAKLVAVLLYLEQRTIQSPLYTQCLSQRRVG